MKGRPKWWKTVRVVLCALLGLWAALMVILQIILSSSFLESVAGKYANEFVDGKVSFDRIKASMIKSFPNLNISIEGLTITYPHERFAVFDSLIPPKGGEPYRLGWGEDATGGGQSDTLAHLGHLSLAVNYMSALGGRIDIGHAVLEHPRIFLHKYDSTRANWGIFRTGANAPDDTSSLRLPPLKVGKVSLSDKPFAVFTSISDTLAASLELDHITMKGHRDHYDLDLESIVSLDMASTGKMELPVRIETKFHPDFQKNIYSVKKLKASVAMIDFSGEAKVDLSGENPYIKADAVIDEEPVSEVTEYFGSNFPILKKLKTDARISLDAHCDGFYIPSEGSLPPLSVHLVVPDSRIAWEGIDENGDFDLEATARVVDGKLIADVPDLCLKIKGLDIQLKGSAEDLLDGDPLLNLDSRIHAKLDSLARFLPSDMGITASGNLDGKVKGTFRPSQLDLYNFSNCGIEGNLVSDGIFIKDQKDSVSAFLGSTSISLGNSEGTPGISAYIDSLNARYGSSTFIRGTGVKLFACNPEEKKKTQVSPPLEVRFDISSIGMMDTDSCFIGVRGSKNNLKFNKVSEGKAGGPHLQLASSNDRIFIRESVNRYSASGLALNISASPTDKSQAQDTLGRNLRRRPRGTPLPDFLSEKDFAKKDINLKLGDGVAKYFNDWDLTGSFKIGGGKVITPYFPLDNRLSNLSGRLTNNKIELNSMTILSGSSDISAKGSLSGIKRAITTGRGRLVLDLGISSNLVDLNEILVALNAGSQFVPPGGNAALAEVGDTDYLESVQKEAVNDTTASSSLIVIPANLNAKVNLQAGTIKYSDLEASFMSTDLEMKERCLQITNTLAMTNMGELFLEGFYSTRTKKDLKAGFDLMLSNITAEKVIQLFPAVDSIMPMLKAFKGLLDCEIASTASIDTSMNIILPSLNGMIKIDGKDLSLSESEDLDKLRKTLMFKDKDSSYINSMSARGIVRENQLEVFPFILKVDRYTLALNGIQGFDQRFKYHVSAIKSPIPFRFGVNLGGTFDSWKWKLGKARFKSTKVPLFDNEIDEVRLNLVNSIHNIFSRGVEHAIMQQEKAQEAVQEKKAETAYSVEETEELSELERKALETLGKISEE